MSKSVIGLVILAVVIIAAVALLGGNGAAPSPSATSTGTPAPQTELGQNSPNAATPGAIDNPAAATQTVTYHPDGSFSPPTLTVPVGTTVVFANQSNSPMWVASDPHPTHTILGEFDSRRNVSQGETYSYTFNQSGTWRYHNHSSPGSTGTVVVQ